MHAPIKFGLLEFARALIQAGLRTSVLNECTLYLNPFCSRMGRVARADSSKSNFIGTFLMYWLVKSSGGEIMQPMLFPINII